MFAVTLSIICLLLINSGARAAQAFNLPKPLKHEGLVFQSPLPEGIGYNYLVINDGPFQTIDFNPVDKKPLDLNIDPTPTPLSQVSEVSITESEVVSTPTPLLTITPSPTKVASPTPIQTASTGPARSASTSVAGGGLNADILFSMSNNYRAGLGLPAFQKDERICSLAAARAPEIASEIAGGHMHSGKDTHGFPYWFTENIITMRTEAEAFNWWINDQIHRVQIVAQNTHSCVACSGNACTQEFTSFQPK